ncbi:MAG TPA: glycosyltransferase 87 family protein [Streptosporangiaceae bacterium]|nr:glycosyltransferase 87 family protein [Streptosporangiaceae bacterium]
MNAVLVAATALALGLRIYQLTRPGYLLGVTEYDDGTDFGSAVLLVDGYLPYRDFIIVQPPGITLLMAPAAVAAKWVGTAWGMAVGRMLTAAAGAAAVGLAGLLVRHRGLIAVILTCGILAVYPAAVQAAHTVLLEPWLVLFCVAGAVAVFDGDRLAGPRRLAWGGAAFGFAGAIKVWAILPVVVILVLAARQPRRAATYAAGVAAGFIVAVLPFAALAPRTFFNSVVLAQLVRIDTVRVTLAFRLHEMTGMTDFTGVATTVPLLIIALAIVVLAGGSCALASRLTRQPPPPLERFALGASAVTVAAFLWPADFYYHYAGFLAPFLAMAVALPVARLVDALRPVDAVAPAAGRRPAARLLTSCAAAAAGIAVIAMAVIQTGAETALQPPLGSTTPGVPDDVVAVVSRLVPPGACVLADQVSYTIAANRFSSAAPGCAHIVDGVGTDYSLSKGRNAATGAQRVPAVRAVWLSALRGAQYVWLSNLSYKRIPWSAAEISDYFDRNFVPVRGGPFGLYVRKGLRPR